MWNGLVLLLKPASLKGSVEGGWLRGFSHKRTGLGGLVNRLRFTSWSLLSFCVFEMGLLTLLDCYEGEMTYYSHAALF